VGVVASPLGLVCRQLQTVQLSTRRGKGDKGGEGVVRKGLLAVHYVCKSQCKVHCLLCNTELLTL
jgi:hypothetical protein